MDRNATSEPSVKTPNLIGSIVTWRAITHMGLTRSQNEDAHWVSHVVEGKTATESSSRYIFVVADGLGGHRGGAIASRMAIKAVKEEFHAWHGGDAGRMIDRAMHKANQNIFCVAQTDPELFQKMQTTLTIVALENDTMVIGHVGDCRLYRMRDGHVDQLTRDHTMASDMLQIRLISPEQASQHPGRHQLTRSVGGDPFMRSDISRYETQPGDTYLLCSDGLWSEITDEEIHAALYERNISKECENLVRLALGRGAPDNITGIMFRVDVTGKQAILPFSWRSIFGQK